ncbi:MAG: hypothetical protein J5I90_21180 [Caldilineales bacterium]|nr:hypothetical protein [Caldilineales bacterium]
MSIQNVNLPLPESLYVRLQQTADSTRQSLTDVLLHAVRVGSPPSWEDAPPAFQSDLAALDRLDDEALWRVVRFLPSEESILRIEALLADRVERELTKSEADELEQLSSEADRLMLRKAHAAALLRWRGHAVPPADRL